MPETILSILAEFGLIREDYEHRKRIGLMDELNKIKSAYNKGV